MSKYWKELQRRAECDLMPEERLANLEERMRCKKEYEQLLNQVWPLVPRDGRKTIVRAKFSDHSEIGVTLCGNGHDRQVVEAFTLSVCDKKWSETTSITSLDAAPE